LTVVLHEVRSKIISVFKWISFILGAYIITQSLHHGIALERLENKLQWCEASKPVCPKTKCPEATICLPKIVTVKEPCPECESCDDFDSEDCKRRYWWLCNDE
jgi:hypothetical protein